MEKPKVIFLDAVGTIFGVKGSVGEVYSQIAAEFGVTVTPEILNREFHKSFAAAPAPIFLNCDVEVIPDKEFNWWYDVVLNTFQGAGVWREFRDFSDFFGELYVHFGTADPWFVYPDVSLALVNWLRLGVELGVVSNFDSRIYSVLQSLGLRDYFKSITVSTQARMAKPDPEIFHLALKNHNCSPESAWHIGDSIVDDYYGARRAGLRGIWINRH